MSYKNITIILLILCSLLSCDKIYYYPDRDSGFSGVKILGHRGISDSLYPENSLQAIVNGLKLLDGIETDLQISKDGTLWLSHNAEITDCNGTITGCFAELQDEQIEQIDSCNGDSISFTKLEDVFRIESATYPGKYISLDVKAWMPCGLTSSGITSMLNLMADKIILLTEKYHLEGYVMVESETATILNYIKKRTDGIHCYLTSPGDFERAMLLSLEEGYTGISFKYKFDEEITSDHIRLIRKKGLKVQLWTVNDSSDIHEALIMLPDFIQTDNANYFLQQ